MDIVTGTVVALVSFWIGYIIRGWNIEDREDEYEAELEHKVDRILYILEKVEKEVHREQDNGSIPFGPNIKLHKEWYSVAEYRNKES